MASRVNVFKGENVKKTKIVTLISLFLVAIVCLILAGCEQGHKHSYSDTYEKDDDYHWKVCLTCNEETKKEAHSFGEWVVDVEPTETKAGSKHATCVCGYEIHESIDPKDDGHQHSFPEVYVNANSIQHYQECSCGYKNYSNHNMSGWTVDLEATATHPGHKYRECNQNCGYTEEETIPQLNPGQHATGTVNFYAINDFHGEHAKLAQIAGYISGQLEKGNTVAINSGDMFQGSMQSNSNFGRLFSECMDDAGFDAFTYGNHEFDWGLDNLRSLAQNSATPFLGANIYNWNANTKTWGDFAEDLAREYVVKQLDSGLRVGIIGVIGKDQITSISSQLVQTIGFKDPSEIIPNLSNKLRNELGCDIVVVSAHTGQSTFLDDTSWDITQYADAVFCAHTHVAETYQKNGVPFIQGGAYGNNVSHVQLVVDGNGNVRCDGYSNQSFYSLTGVNSFVKDKVQAKIDNSNSRIEDEASQVLATLSGGNLNSSTAVPRLVANAIADYAVSEGYNDIDLVMVNNARSSLSQSSITYSDLYEAIPFDNVVYIAKVSGYDILAEASYSSNSVWRVSGKAIVEGTYYKIAVLDYLLFHQNSNRDYNYFRSAFSSGFDPIPLTKTGVDMYNYRLITRDYLKKVLAVDATKYTVDNDYTDKNKLSQTVDLGGSGGTTTPTEPTHAGTQSDPYSVADAILLASNYTSSNGAPGGFIKGTVYNVNNAGLSSTSGDIYNVYITDGNGNSLLLYYVKKYQGATKDNNWGSTSEVSVGDELLLYAQSLYTYNGTPEVYNGYVVTINGVATK